MFKSHVWNAWSDACSTSCVVREMIAAERRAWPTDTSSVPRVHGVRKSLPWIRLPRFSVSCPWRGVLRENVCNEHQKRFQYDGRGDRTISRGSWLYAALLHAWLHLVGMCLDITVWVLRLPVEKVCLKHLPTILTKCQFSNIKIFFLLNTKISRWWGNTMLDSLMKIFTLELVNFYLIFKMSILH